MPACSKWIFSFALVVLLIPAVFAQSAVLIDEGEERRNESIESRTSAETEWNRPSYQEEPDVPAVSTNKNNEKNRAPANDKTSEPQDSEDPANNSDSKTSTSQPPSARHQIFPPGQNTNEAWSSVFDLRKHKRLGIGASFLGRAGFVGLDAELNLTEEHSALVSFGGGPGYTGTAVGWKWTPLHGTWHPTASMAVASWVADQPATGRTENIPGFFGPDKGQSADERARQVYLVPAVGIETMKLTGEGAGALLFVEVLFFAQIPTFDLKPLGSVGAKYFF